MYDNIYEFKDLQDFELFHDDDINTRRRKIMEEKYHLLRYPLNVIKKLKKKKTVIANNYSNDVLIDNLSKEDKAFLYYVMCKSLNDSEILQSQKTSNFKLPTTELIRLNSIMNLKDEYCFTGNYRDSLNYKILNQGLNYFSKDNQIAFLENLIKKLSKLQIGKTVEVIKKMINKEYNNLAKSNKKTK